MANYIENFNSKLDWTMPFQRTSKFPLDRSCMFSSYDDAVLYASGGADTRGLGGTSYVGQLIVVFENDVVTVYKINADRTIEALTSESGVNADILDLQNQLNAEIAARKAVDGQTGQTYAKNSDATHISAATSLNDADVKLNNAITAETKARQDAINALDATVTSSTTNVGVTVVQTNGKLSSVTLTQTDIASAAALTAEIAARKAVDGQTGQTYAKNTSAKHISGATSLNDADVKLNNAITAETKARQDAINALDATVSGNGTHVDVTVSQLNGKITRVSVAESDIASASGLSAEITARKAVDGQTGQTYAKNTAYTHISAATSLNDADIRLNNAITAETKARQDAINALDATVSGNGTHVDVTVSQLNGKITRVSVAESDIASAAALTAEIAARKAVDGQTGQTYAKNTAYTHISAATSLNDADIRLNNAITAETKARQDAINALDATVSGNGTHVDVTVSQLNGKITGVSVAESDIASAAALTAEIAARKAVDGQTRQTYAKNSGATYISAATSLNDADIKLNNAITNLKITSATTNELSSLGTNVKEAYKLIDGNSTQHGNWIKIYKDSALQEVYLGLSNDTINATTGVITKNTVPSGQIAQSLNFKYQLTDGTYSLVKVDISKFLAETEYADGLQVSNGVISVKKDSSSESFLSVSSNGVKLSGVQNAIDTAVNNLDATVSGNGTHVDVTVSQLNGKITRVSVAESDIASASGLSAEITARKAVDGQTGQTYAKNTAYTHISAATSLNDADIRLNNAITAETKARQDAINALDATVSGNGTHVDVTVSQLNGKITRVSVAESDIASAAALTNLTNWCAYMSGHTTVSAVTSIPTTKRLCIATISSSQTLGLNGSITDGREVHIIVKNNSTSDITVTIPSSIKNLVGENLIIEGSSYGEINLTSDGTNVYYRGVGK